jgi:4,5-dihydroxyphthalate decarboxylase
MLTKPDKLKLFTLMGSYPNAMALKEGKLASDILEFDFADVKVSNTAFKPLVRDAKFDLAEVAIVTFLQAYLYGKPYVLIPATVVGRGQLHTIAYNPERGALKPSDLNGKTLGVRAYTQTTGVWVRGILAEDYGVDLNSIKWVTFEEGHIAEYDDPPNVRRAPEGKQLVQMLLDGELDAAVVGDKLPDPRLRHLFPDVEAVARKWAQSHGGIPINHMVVMRQDLAISRPDVAKELFRLLLASKRATQPPVEGGALDPLRFGVEACRPTLEIIIDYAARQGLIPKKIAVDDLFDDVTRALAP